MGCSGPTDNKQEQPTTQAAPHVAEQKPDSTSGFAPVNGLKMYYEIHGSGKPLVLIHGGGSTINTTWGRVLHEFARTRQVIAVEMQAHGRTADIDRPLSFTQDADDIAALLAYLKIRKADIFGFSNGASTTLQCAVRHPELVNKIVVASTFTKRAGAQPWLWGMMDKAVFDDMPQAFKNAFLEVNPDTNALHRMFERDNSRMRNFTDTPDEQIMAITSPTLIVTGDQDIALLEHTVEMQRMIQGSRLAVLPGGHGEFIGEITMPQDSVLYMATVHLVNKFLDAPASNQQE